MKFRVFWDLELCSHFEVDRRFRGAVNHRPDDAVSISETSVNFNVTTRAISQKTLNFILH
jgi:hypothetical protein